MPAIVRDIAPAIAAALGDGWTATQSEHNENAATLSGPAGAEVFIWTNAYPHRHQRAEIVGQYPEHKPYDVKRHEITVSLDKTAEQIARDITRRLLPAYLPDLARALETQRGHEEYAYRTRLLAEQVAGCAIVSARPNEWRSSETRREHSLNLSTGYGTVTVAGDSVSLELNSITPEAALRILDILAHA